MYNFSHFIEHGTVTRNTFGFLILIAGPNAGVLFTRGWLDTFFHHVAVAVFLQSMSDVIIGLSHGNTKMFYGTFKMQHSAQKYFSKYLC